MERRLSIHIVFNIAAVLLVACEPNGCFEKNGAEVSEEIPVTSYTELSVYGKFDIVLMADTTDYIEFITKESVLPHLSAEVHDSTMILQNSFNCFYQRDFRKVKANIHFSDLKKINLYEASKLTTDEPIKSTMSIVAQAEMAEVDIEIDAERFYFYNHRTTGGKFRFRGAVDYSSISGYYTAQFDLDKLEVRRLKLNNSSISDMYVHVIDKLEVQIHHRGNIYYTGNPEIVIDSISGSGRLIHLE